MVIVPIINSILHPEREAAAQVNSFEPPADVPMSNLSAVEQFELDSRTKEGHFDSSQGSEDISMGILFASKAIVQLISNTVTGTFIDRVG